MDPVFCQTGEKISINIPFTLIAILGALVSLVAMLLPTTCLETNGLEITPYTINQRRVFGAVSTRSGRTAWLLRDAGSTRARRASMPVAGASFFFFAAVRIVNLLGAPGLETSIGGAYFNLIVLQGAAFLKFGRREPEATA